MAVTVKVAEAKTHLSELLAKVEAGEEVIISRGNTPIARLSRIRKENDIETAIAETCGIRSSAARIRATACRSRWKAGCAPATCSRPMGRMRLRRCSGG